MNLSEAYLKGRKDGWKSCREFYFNDFIIKKLDLLENIEDES